MTILANVTKTQLQTTVLTGMYDKVYIFVAFLWPLTYKNACTFFIKLSINQSIFIYMALFIQKKVAQSVAQTTKQSRRTECVRQSE